MEHSKALWDWKLKDNADGRSSITASVAGGATARSSITFHATSSMRHSHHLIQRSMVPLVRSFYDLSALQWDRRELNFSRFKGKVVLITNTATAHPQSNSQFIQLNQLSIKKRELVILAFPSNFLNDEPWSNSEIMNCLRYVRPGGNFKPRFYLMAKTEANGTNCHPVYEYLKKCLPMVSMTTLQSNITANFEKFLVNHQGKPSKRLPPTATTSQLEEEIDLLLKK